MFERHLAPELHAALRDTPVTMLIGPRQSGKSTLAQEFTSQIEGARYRTLDDGITLAAARDDPAGFVDSEASTLIVDEVQRAPDLLREIKASVDRDRRPGRFVLTGSADVLTLPRVAETLAGRMEVLRLWPLSQGEIEGHRDAFLDTLLDGRVETLAAGNAVSKQDLLARIEAGGFPEAVARTGARRRRWFDSYLETVLQREVRDLSNVTGFTDLPRLMLLLAARSTGLLSYAGISRDLGMPQTTLKRYLALLEATFLVHTIPAWYRNIGKRLIKSPKLILTDSGLLAQLLGGGNGVDRLFGPALENFVLMEIVKQASVSDARPSVFHYRTAEGVEVDAVIEPRGGPLCAVEVKAAATLTARDSHGLRSLATALGDDFGTGVILHTGHEAARLAPKIWALPMPVLWAPL